MNNVLILIASIIVLAIGYVQCCNSEDMALFVLACFIVVPAVVVSAVGIVIGVDVFEM